MRAQEGTFRSLMTQDRQFRVPLYQRHYRWRTDQQDDLWQDILEQYRAVAEAGSDVPRHFIGSIVAVEREPDPLHDFRDFRIVDGQQRLTTLSVAIAGAARRRSGGRSGAVRAPQREISGQYDGAEGFRALGAPRAR